MGFPYVPMYMVPLVRKQASTDIAETTTRIDEIACDLPAIHALSRCDAVAATEHWEPDSNQCGKEGQILVVYG